MPTPKKPIQNAQAPSQVSSPLPVAPAAPKAAETSMHVGGATGEVVEASAVDLGIGGQPSIQMRFSGIHYKSVELNHDSSKAPTELYLEVEPGLSEADATKLLSKKTGHKVAGFRMEEVAFTPDDLEETSNEDGAVFTLEVGGFKGMLLPDEDIGNPRTENDNVGTMVCFHKRGNYGDKDHGYRSEDHGGWDALEKAILKDHPGAVILPVYMYDHSGVALRTTPFGDPWDSGQLGLIFADRKKVLEEWGGKGAKQVTPAIRAAAERCLTSEVEEYSRYVNGEGHGYRVLDPNGDEVDSCWGFLGYDYAKEEMADALLSSANEAARKAKVEGVAP